MEVLILVVSFFVIVFFWKKVLEWLGVTLASVLIFIEEKLEDLKKEFSLTETTLKKERSLQAGDTCPRCGGKGVLQMEYLPLHPAMAGDMGIYAPWPYNLVCSHCHAVTAGEY